MDSVPLPYRNLVDRDYASPPRKMSTSGRISRPATSFIGGEVTLLFHHRRNINCPAAQLIAHRGTTEESLFLEREVSLFFTTGDHLAHTYPVRRMTLSQSGATYIDLPEGINEDRTIFDVFVFFATRENTETNPKC